LSRRHVVPADVFAALAAGGGGPRAVELLAAAQRSKRLLLLRAIRDGAPADTGGRAAEGLVRAYDLLASLDAASPAAARAVEQVIAYPAVATWAAAAARTLLRRDGAVPDPGYLSAVAAAAAVRAGADASVRVPVVAGRVVLPSLGAARIGSSARGGEAAVRSGRDGAVVEAPGRSVRIPADPGRARGSGWSPLRRIELPGDGRGLAAVLDDIDPYSFPGRDRVLWLSDSELDRWRLTLADAWQLLLRLDPDGAAAEVAATVAVLVPVPAPPGRHVSATSRDAYGTVALSAPTGASPLAATLVHEVQHAKLGALLDLVPLLEGPADARWYAPWRDDPRPLGGLLHGAYAHLGVAGFWRRQRWLDAAPEARMHAHAEFARWRDQTAEAVRTLRASGALTGAGERFVDGMAATLEQWQGERVPAEAAARARDAAERHRRAWKLRHARRRPPDEP
jgi:HEXXH motif-containing protein